MTLLDVIAASGGMDPGIIVAIVMGVASIIGTVIAGYYTYQSAKRNAAATREVEADKLSTASWEAQVTNWRQDVITLREQRAEDLAAYTQQKNECDRRIRALTERVEELVAEQETSREKERIKQLELEHRIDALTSWGRKVVTIMRTQGIEFPPPPPGLTDADLLGPAGQTWD